MICLQHVLRHFQILNSTSACTCRQSNIAMAPGISQSIGRYGQSSCLKPAGALWTVLTLSSRIGPPSHTVIPCKHAIDSMNSSGDSAIFVLCQKLKMRVAANQVPYEAARFPGCHHTPQNGLCVFSFPEQNKSPPSTGCSSDRRSSFAASIHPQCRSW